VWRLWGRYEGLICCALVILLSLAAQIHDFITFSTELLAALSIAIAGSILALRWRPESKHCLTARTGLLVGSLLGLSILGKMQALPIALFLTFACLFFMLREKQTRSIVGCLYAIAGFFTPVLLLMLFLAYHGELGNGIYSLFVFPFRFAGSPNYYLDWFLAALNYLAQGWIVLKPFLVVLGGLIVIGIVLLKPRLPLDRRDESLLFFFGWLGISIVSALRAPHRAPHHGIFLVFPLIVLIPLMIGRLRTRCLHVWLNSKWLSGGLAVLFFSILTFLSVPLLGIAIDFTKQVYGFYHKNEKPIIPWAPLSQPLAEIIKTCTRKDQTILVWGWADSVYLYSDRRSASRFTQSIMLINDYGRRKYLQDLFMRDLKEKPPAIIADALVPGFFMWEWKDSDQLRPEALPDFKYFIAENYQLIKKISCFPNSRPARVFLRNDMMKFYF
ncbi:MAG: hypothetical protein L7F78_04770, partial [Syntrophales bacterium LBB04]|nr:hypothetical protein [Syntrophales bacterium LBB04]